MSLQILSTKLSIPPSRARLVTRPRLIQKLHQGLDCGFILVSAPAGYGKSTLLSSWLSRLEYPVTWLSLDDSDNDPGRFMLYMFAALQMIDPSYEDLSKPELTPDFGQDLESHLSELINRLTLRKQPCCLVLDDYHVIQNQVVHKAIGFLLEHRPAPLKLVISTRADPPLPLAKLRAQSCLFELRMADLRFTLAEAADFLAYTMGLTVTVGDAARLTKRTEGWIAGLQIAALSLQTTDDISAFISNFTGSHHYLFDYLLEEIMARQPFEVQRFLLFTSVLDQLTGPLCDALLEPEAAPAPTRPASLMLEDLYHANLFIIPLDHEQRWYRYHPLFAELLRSFLKKNDPAKIPILHARASVWLEAQGLIPEAIRHALAASNWELTIRLISANIFALLEQNELNNVSQQISNLIGEANPARPWLLIGRAWLDAYTGQLNSVEPTLKLAEAEIDRLRSEQELQILGGHIAAIRAYTNWISDNREISIQAARAALEWLPESERLIRCQVSTLLGLSLDDFDEREKSLKSALSYARECPVSHVTIFAHGCWSWFLAMQGRLHESNAAGLEAIQLAGTSGSHQSLPTLSHVYASLSTVLCEWNDLEGAIRYGKEAVEIARRWEQADAMHFALDTLGYALFASGDVTGAFECLRQAWKVATRTSDWFEQISISQELEWYLMQGNLDAAIHRLQVYMVEVPSPSQVALGEHKSVLLPMTFIQIFISQKEYTKALELSARLIEELSKKKLGHYLIRLYLWQALSYYALKQETKALESLKHSLSMAIPESYLRTFIQEGNRVIPLLQHARKSGVYPDYIEKLLAIIGKVTEKAPPWAVATSQLVEQLTEREMDVIRLLAQGYTDKKIAENLVIARETVHKHLKNIYGKLDVHSRSEAVLRVRQMNLL